jgi:spermidine/putrescine ABC transporter ATP-binding subunit
MSEAGAAVSIRGVRKTFGATVALRELSLELGSGEFVSLLGPSGCGKTTLLRIIGGFIEADAGEVWLEGGRIDGLPPNRRAVNTVFQSYALFSHKTVLGNVAFPLEIAKAPKAERTERVREMLSLVRLDGLGDRPVSALSGGQAQRVALARALVGRPEVLLLDEPLAALDLKLRKAMQLELRRIHDRLGTTFIYVTHDQEEALTMSDRIVLMNEGAIVQQGAPQEIYDLPADPFASDFLGEANLIPAQFVGRNGDRVALRVGSKQVSATASASVDFAGDMLLSLRPERITTAPQDEDNRLSGNVQRLVFVGHSVRALIELDGGSVITAQVSRRVSADLAEGSAIEIGWHVEDAVLMQAPDAG